MLTHIVIPDQWIDAYSFSEKPSSATRHIRGTRGTRLVVSRGRYGAIADARVISTTCGEKCIGIMSGFKNNLQKETTII